MLRDTPAKSAGSHTSGRGHAAVRRRGKSLGAQDFLVIVELVLAGGGGLIPYGTRPQKDHQSSYLVISEEEEEAAPNPTRDPVSRKNVWRISQGRFVN